MSSNSFDSGVPTFRQQGPTPLMRLALCAALAVFLMVADVRFKLTEPLRKVVATVLYPLQWVMLQPVQLVHEGGKYFDDLHTALLRFKADRQIAHLQHRRRRRVLGEVRGWLSHKKRL